MNIFILTFHKHDKAFAADLYLIYNRSPAARVCKSDTDRLLMLYLVLTNVQTKCLHIEVTIRSITQINYLFIHLYILSILPYPARNFACLTILSLPVRSCTIIPSCHFPRLRSSFLMITTSPIFGETNFVPCFRLCLSGTDLRYSLVQRRQIASLHFCKYFARFLRSVSSMLRGSSCRIVFGCPKNIELGVEHRFRRNQAASCRRLLRHLG